MKCSACGKDFGGSSAFEIDISQTPQMPNIKHLLGPYKEGTYRFCFECILFALGVPKPASDEQLQNTIIDSFAIYDDIS